MGSILNCPRQNHLAEVHALLITSRQCPCCNGLAKLERGSFTNSDCVYILPECLLLVLILEYHSHCATHQIRVILISCVVITSLFYPALDVYTSSKYSSPAFQFDHLSEGSSAISASLYLAYIGFFAYVAWSVRRMDAVHSRLGVTFTALVEITVSTITSLSVCALVGFNVTMVPW